MMLSAMPPFQASTNAEILRKVREGSYSLNDRVWDTVSVPPKNFIGALLKVEAKLRPTAAEALQEAWLSDIAPLAKRSQ